MKKLLLSVFAALCAFGANAATEVTFDFDNNATALFGIEGRSSNDSHDGDITTDAVATLEGVSVTVSPKASGSYENRLWTTSPVLRMYNGTLTVSAPGHDITGIVFATGNNFNIASVSVGTLEGKIWSTDTKTSSVVFTIQKNTQIKSMTVTLDGEGGPAIAGTGEGTVAIPYDVERAISLINNDMVTTDKVYITGSIATIEEYSIQYGNATYILAQGDKQIKVYRGYYYNGEKFTEVGLIKEGDVVVVYGKLVIEYGGQITTGSSIYSINGVTAPQEPETPYIPVGNGSKENPYTVADVQNMKIETSDGQKYWVKGYILGSCASATSLNTADKATDTNIALGETADATTFIPVALPAGDIRTELGVATNPGHVGKEVAVYGTLEKYFSAPGVKNVTEFEGEGFSGIAGVAVGNAPAHYYNLQGVEVANPESGRIYIRVSGNKAEKIIK